MRKEKAHPHDAGAPFLNEILQKTRKRRAMRYPIFPFFEDGAPGTTNGFR